MQWQTLQRIDIRDQYLVLLRVSVPRTGSLYCMPPDSPPPAISCYLSIVTMISIFIKEFGNKFLAEIRTYYTNSQCIWCMRDIRSYANFGGNNTSRQKTFRLRSRSIPAWAARR